LRQVDDMTQILQAADTADPKVAEQLLPLVYDELRRLAAAKISNERPGQTLQATALVHEAYLRLVRNGEQSWHDRRHFFGAAAEAMRHILVDRARRKSAVRHGGEMTRLNLDDVFVASQTTGENVLRVNDALEKLAAHDQEAAELVKLRFFGGFQYAEAAELLGLSERTAKRKWAYARAWLFNELTRDP
jgi:RNA polymerase sigma factor (TIGR02999 family)